MDTELRAIAEEMLDALMGILNIEYAAQLGAEEYLKDLDWEYHFDAVRKTIKKVTACGIEWRP